MVRKLEPGRYTVTDICSGMTLDLYGDKDRRLNAWELDGGTRQQWDFRPCGEGFIINSVHSSGSFVTVRDLKGLHQGGSARVVPGSLPTCWDVEVLPVGPTDSEPGDVFARIRLPYSDGTQMTLGFKKNPQWRALFPGERPLHLLAGVPGGEPLGESRRGQADHDK